MAKTILKFLVVFLIGVLGGVWAQASLLPYLAQFQVFQNVGFIRNLGDGQVTINPTQKVTIQENTALTDAVDEVGKTVVGVRTVTPDGEVLEGSGLIVTSDGLIVTLASLVPKGSEFYFYVNGEWPSWQVLKRDTVNNLALIKVGKSGLGTAAFADPQKTKLGERVFLSEMDFGQRADAQATNTSLIEPTPAVNEGIVSSVGDKHIITNIYDPRGDGSPLFDVAGNIVGLNVVDESGRVTTVPISIIRNFIGL